MNSRRSIAFVCLFAVSALLPNSAHASLDIAELFLRKVRQGERTFFQDGGWSHWRNRADFFYEADYILGAGTGDPRFVSPLSEGDPLGTYSLGGIALLSRPRSAYQLSFFTLISKTFEVDTGNSIFQALPILAPIVPGAFGKDRAASLLQGVTGFQLRIQPWAEGTFGLLLDERRGVPVYRAFFETNVPFLFLHGNFIAAPDDGRLERVQTFLRYDQASFASALELGLVRQHVNQKRTFLFLGFDQLFGFLVGDLRITSGFDFAYADLGIHFSKFGHGDVEKNGKFGFAWDVRAVGSIAIPENANIWSDSYGTSDIQPGFRAEAYFQAPIMTYLGIFMLMASAQSAALEQDPQRREEMTQQGVDAAMQAFNAADEDDSTYGGFTFGIALNDPTTLREIPGAIDHLHIYFRFRVLY